MIATEKRPVRVPSGELAVVEAGYRGPPVVLLSGGFTSSHCGGTSFRSSRRGCTCSRPTCWVRGIWSRPNADLSLPAHAADVRALLGALGIGRFAVAGHGRGAGIAQLLAVEGGVEALVLVDAVAFDAWPSPRIEELRTRLGEVDDSFIRSWLEGLFRVGMGHPERLSEADLEEFRAPSRVRVAPNASCGRPPRWTVWASSILSSVWPSSRSGVRPVGGGRPSLPADLAERLGDTLPWAAVALPPRATVASFL